MSFWAWLKSVLNLFPLESRSMRTIAVIDNEPIKEWGDGSISFTAKASIDADGSGPSHGDKYYQPDTTLHLDGKPLNSDVDKYIVVPPAICLGVKPAVLGCQVMVLNIENGKHTQAVVGDIGPRKKLGEVSIACAKALGIPWSPVTGGVSEHIIQYSLKPGVAANVDGKLYKLQPYK